MSEKAQLFWQRVLSKVDSQQELARMTGIKRGTISTQISGKRFPKLEEALTIAHTLKTPLEEFVGIEPIKKTPSIASMADVSSRLEALKKQTEHSLKLLLNSPLTQLTKEMHELVHTLERMLQNYTIGLDVIEETAETDTGKYSISAFDSPPEEHKIWDIPKAIHQVPSLYIPSGSQQNYFVFHSNDESMADSGIEKDSYCLIRKNDKAEHGQVVVIRITNVFILKQFLRNKEGQPLLAYCDGSKRAISYTSRMNIIGTLVRVLKPSVKT